MNREGCDNGRTRGERQEGLEKIKSVAGVVMVRKLDNKGGTRLFKPIK